jgi:hypothetical protein
VEVEAGRFVEGERMSSKPQEEAAVLRDLLQGLIDFGALNLGQGYALMMMNLNEIDRNLADREHEAAVWLLRGFISHVKGFVTGGALTAIQGRSLIDRAQDVIEQL